MEFVGKAPDVLAAGGDRIGSVRKRSAALDRRIADVGIPLSRRHAALRDRYLRDHGRRSHGGLVARHRDADVRRRAQRDRVAGDDGPLDAVRGLIRGHERSAANEADPVRRMDERAGRMETRAARRRTALERDALPG